MKDLTFDTADTLYDSSDFKHGDVIKMYKESSTLLYPCIVLECDQLPKYKVEAMKGLLGKKTLLLDDDTYAIYIHLQGKLVQIGTIPLMNLKTILNNSIFDSFNKKVHLDSSTTVTGDMLFALCKTDPRLY